jgi:hypothetical protein
VITHDSKLENRSEYATPPSTLLVNSATTAFDRSNPQLAAYNHPYASANLLCPCPSPIAATAVPIVALTAYPNTYTHPISRFANPCPRYAA